MTALIILIVLLYDLAVLAGTAYLVVEHNWSAWWFLFAACILTDAKIGKNND